MTKLASPTASKPIRHAAELELPPQVDEVMANLTAAGAQAFSRELVAALVRAKSEDDLRPWLEVVEAWYRTLVLVKDPGYAANLQAAKRIRSRRGHTVEQLKQRFGV